VPHDRLLEEAELTARQILRNSQLAVRSAKETILDVIGRPLDDQLRIEALNAYACADEEETMELLSAVRLGVSMKLLPDMRVRQLNQLLLWTQVAHLEKRAGRSLSKRDREHERSKLIREILDESDNRELREGR